MNKEIRFVQRMRRTRQSRGRTPPSRWHRRTGATWQRDPVTMVAAVRGPPLATSAMMAYGAMLYFTSNPGVEQYGRVTFLSATSIPRLSSGSVTNSRFSSSSVLIKQVLLNIG